MPDISRLAQVRARINLPVARRAAGLLEGRHRSVYKGHGQDFDDLHLYAPGEDVGDIDWKASARSGQPVVRRFVRESNLTVVLVVDTGRAMGATAPSGEPKSEVAAFCCSLVAYLARDRGDRVALVAGDAERLKLLPPRASTRDLEILLHTLEGMWDPHAPASDLSRPLERTSSWFTRRCLVIVVTDSDGPAPAVAQRLRSMRVRHELMVVQVPDINPLAAAELSSAAGPGDSEVLDVDGGLELPEFVRGHASVAREADQAMADRREQVHRMLHDLQIEYVEAASTDEVVPAFVRVLGRMRRVRR